MPIRDARNTRDTHAGRSHAHTHTCERATRENTIKAAPGKNTNLNGTKEICSHIRCIRMNGARLLQFTIYCFATFFSADASGIRSLLPVFSLAPLPFSPHRPLSRPSRALALFLTLESPDTRQKKQRGKAGGERERERERMGGRGWQGRTIREVKPLLPKRIMRGKIKFFSTRPFELHRPRDHALLLLVLYTVYTFRGMFSLSCSLSLFLSRLVTLSEPFRAFSNRSSDHLGSFREICRYIA